MPRRVFSKRRPRRMTLRRRFNRKRKAYSKKTLVNRGLGPIAPRFVTHLKYCDQYKLTSTLGVPAAQIWNLNSIHDPDRTGTGHQPYGYDQISALYGRYRVFATSWAIRAAVDVANANYNYSFTSAVCPTNSVTAVNTNMSLFMEQPRCVAKLTATGNSVLYKGHISLPRLNGATVAQYKGDDRFQAIIGASPSEIMTLVFQAAHPDATVTESFTVDVTLVYHVEFFDPPELGQS